jgi:HPr kinase/phosphorylase
MAELDVQAFFNSYGEELQLSWLSEPMSGVIGITVADITRPGLLLAGFSGVFANEQLQIIGEVELAFLASLDTESRRAAVERLFEFELPCAFIAEVEEVDPLLIEAANRSRTPLFLTTMPTTTFKHQLLEILADSFAPAVSVHATLVDVYGVGLLFTGRSAIGKSECALDLVERGHRLVADDVVNIKQVRSNILIGSSNDVLTHHVEIRGLGIIDVKSIFGIRAIRGQKRVEVEVNLRDWDSSEDYERLGMDEKRSTILGTEIPMAEVPIFPGKNITVISETIALNYLVRAYGYDPAQSFSDRLLQTMEEKRRRFETIARGDRE